MEFLVLEDKFCLREENILFLDKKHYISFPLRGGSVSQLPFLNY